MDKHELTQEQRNWLAHKSREIEDIKRFRDEYPCSFDSTPCDTPCEHPECTRFEECRNCTTLTPEPFECSMCKTKFCNKCAATELSICGKCNLEFCSKCDCGHDQWGVN